MTSVLHSKMEGIYSISLLHQLRIHQELDRGQLLTDGVTVLQLAICAMYHALYANRSIWIWIQIIIEQNNLFKIVISK